MTIEDIRLFVNFQLNKHQTGDTLSPGEYNTCLKFVNLEYFKTKYGLPEEYQPGRPLPRQAFEVTQQIMDELGHLKVWKGGPKSPAMLIDINGVAQIPLDYIHCSSIRTNDGRMIEILRDDELGDRITNPIKKPTSKYPVVAFFDTFIQFYPKDLGFCNFTYLRMPATPIWAYTIVNDEPVYDPLNSVELEWPSIAHTDIANAVLKYASLNLREYNMYQSSQIRKEQGN